MKTKYPLGPASLGHEEAIAQGELSRLVRHIRSYEEAKPWLEGTGCDPAAELRTWHSRHSELLNERAFLFKRKLI
jgi:hypothetical protein